MSLNFSKGIVGIFVLFLIIAGARQVLKPSVEKEISKACEELNKGCPKMIDKGVRIDGVTSGENKLMVYKYTMVNISKEDIDPAKFQEAIEKELKNGAKTDSNIQSLLKVGAQLRFTYYDKNDVLIAECTIKE